MGTEAAEETTTESKETTTEAAEETTTESEETSTGELPSFDVVCPESEDGYAVFAPHPYDCNLYYECVGITPVLMSCPGDLEFDNQLNVCNWPEIANCHPKTTTTTTEVAVKTTTTSTTKAAENEETSAMALVREDWPSFDVVCPESEDGYAVFAPHPYDC